MRRPSPVQVLGNSAIALQKLYRSSFRDEDWVGAERADVLFVKVRDIAYSTIFSLLFWIGVD